MSARQLTHESAPVVAGMQTWTADGNWIYFGLFGRRDPEMCRINPDGSRFEDLGVGIDPAISPDGRVIVYAKNDQAGHYLFAAEPGGKNERQLTVAPNSFAGVHAIWTPDGEKVIYADQVESALELFSVAPDGSRRKQLTSLRKASTSPFVSPDGAWVTFRLCDEIYWRDPVSSERAYRERKADLRPAWLMGVDGSNPRVCELMHYHTTIDGSKVPFRKCS
jgi:Tol biopolymer transport system component